MSTAKKPHYVVVHPFGDYGRGDKITTAAAMQAVQDAGQMHHIVTIKEPPEPEPEPDPA